MAWMPNEAIGQHRVLWILLVLSKVRSVDIKVVVCKNTVFSFYLPVFSEMNRLDAETNQK